MTNKVKFAEPCHFDVMVTAIRPEEASFAKMSNPNNWNIISGPEYSKLEPSGGIPGGLWVFPELAPYTVIFNKVTDVAQWLDDHQNEYAVRLWGPALHPRDDQPAAIVKDQQLIIWGVHQHESR